MQKSLLIWVALAVGWMSVWTQEQQAIVGQEKIQKETEKSILERLKELEDKVKSLEAENKSLKKKIESLKCSFPSVPNIFSNSNFLRVNAQGVPEDWNIFNYENKAVITVRVVSRSN